MNERIHFSLYLLLENININYTRSLTVVTFKLGIIFLVVVIKTEYISGHIHFYTHIHIYRNTAMNFISKRTTNLNDNIPIK